MLLRKGLRQLKTVQADVVLIDPQFAPKVLAMPEIDEMIDLVTFAVATISKYVTGTKFRISSSRLHTIAKGRRLHAANTDYSPRSLPAPRPSFLG